MVYDLIDYHLRECIKREVKMRVCKNCGRYFALTGRTNTEYCSRPFDEKGRTCREVGAIALWTKRKSRESLCSHEGGKAGAGGALRVGRTCQREKSGVRSGEAVPGRLRCLAAGIMIKKEKLSGADCMQSTPCSFRYEPIFLQKMGYKRTSSQGIRPDVEMLGADTAIEAKSIHDGVLQNFYDSIFCASPCPSFCWRSFPCHDSLC